MASILHNPPQGGTGEFDPEILRTEIPRDMAAARRWLLWRSEPHTDPSKKFRKVPYYTSGARRGPTDTPEDAAALVGMEEALAALEASPGHWSGLGFALGLDTNTNLHWQGIDLDAINEHHGHAELAALLPGYREMSPSGEGVHAVGIGLPFRSLGSNGSGIEAYASGRYFTVTGNAIGGDLEDLAPFVEKALVPRHSRKERPQGEGATGGGFAHHLNDARLAEIRSALAYCDAVDYGPWLRTLMALKALTEGSETGLMLAHEFSRHCPEKYDPATVDAKWQSITVEGGVSGATLFHIAQERGWTNPKARVKDAPQEAQEPPGRDGGRETPKAKAKANPVPSPASLIASEEELEAAHLTPRCIVRHHSYADVAAFLAPGGTGKTTLLIYEAVQIALGRPLYGLPVEAPGYTLFVTAEDARERFLARLREILKAMELTVDERRTALRGMRVWDVTGEARKLVAMSDGNVVLTPLADQIIEACREDPPVQIVFDPLVSFGATEQAVNDNEQAIVTACRRLVNGLGCCVRVIHHTGKANAREATLDQYSNRGGSALPDGARMVSVMQVWKDGMLPTPPAACTRTEGASITMLARPKLSHAPPDLPLIWIRRTGFRFDYFLPDPVPTAEQLRDANADQLERFLLSQLKDGRHYSARELDAVAKDTLSMTRGEVRAALAELRVSGRLVESELPKSARHGGRQRYLHPTAYSPAYCAEPHGAVDLQEGENLDSTAPPFYCAAPYRENTCGAVETPHGSPPLPALRGMGTARYGAVGAVMNTSQNAPDDSLSGPDKKKPRKSRKKIDSAPTAPTAPNAPAQWTHLADPAGDACVSFVGSEKTPQTHETHETHDEGKPQERKTRARKPRPPKVAPLEAHQHGPADTVQEGEL